MKIADMHCDTISAIYFGRKQSGTKEPKLNQNQMQLDLNKMKQSGYLVQNFALFVDLNGWENPLEACLLLADLYYTELEQYPELILPAKSYADILEHERNGKMSGVLTIEEGGTTKGSLEQLRNFYRLGVRMLTLTWNYPNELGYPNALNADGIKNRYDEPNTSCGLTKTGIEFLEEMERLGMIIDVSHLSDAGFYDVVKHTHKPFVASHSNFRAICRHRRNLSEDMIRILSERGGVMGINYAMDFLKDPVGEEQIHAGVQEIVAHILSIRNVAGSSCIGLGSDFDGIERNDDLQNAACLPMLEDALHHAQLSQEEIDGIFYKNVLGVYRELLH